jgi:hypothetical protein
VFQVDRREEGGILIFDLSRSVTSRRYEPVRMKVVKSFAIPFAARRDPCQAARFWREVSEALDGFEGGRSGLFPGERQAITRIINSFVSRPARAGGVA